jgi:class III poly(R)-hydroxyalkanoic acid synthase PhaE subunit
MQHALDKCFDMGKGYFTMAEQIGKGIDAGASTDEAVMQWLEQIKAMMMQMSGQGSTGGPTAVDGFVKQWFGPVESWQQMAAAMTPMQQSAWQMPGINTSVFNMGEATDPMGKILSSPGLGYFREPQEKQQKGIQLALDYQQSNFKFNQAFLQVSITSLQEFQQRIMGLDPSESPGSLRELYDLWVNISEAHYAEFAMGEEYQALYGDMVNRLMALKKHYSEITDDLLKTMNLPARSEIDTMQQRLQQLRRENLTLKKEVGEIRSMLEKIDTASLAVDNKIADANKTPVTRKATVSKKTAVKKKAADAQKTRVNKAKTGAG